ncbi:MAG: carbohydrate binding family 9 domain-containing protein [bacterium]|nr:carbohydrate binding family 9 domain-containing protein [bacterium]
MKKIITAVYFLALLAVILPAKQTGKNHTETHNQTLQIVKLTGKLAIDGKLEERAYTQTKPASGFRQFHPQNGDKATLKTEAYAFYDNKNIYFAFKCFDDQPKKITADITPFGGYGNNDEILIYLDTFYDKQTYETFAINPRGIKKGKQTVWKAEARLTDYGWSAEFKIPFKSLRFPAREEQTWGVNFKRTIFRLNETDYWAPVARDKAEVLGDTFATIEGLRDIKGGKNIEVFPYAGYRNSSSYGEKDNKFAYGVDVKYGITSNLTLDLTTSPDYSEVESDPFFYQMYAFENFLAENRPFYNEASGYFNTVYNLFYSRRVSNPTVAAKITGKEKGFSLGLLAARNGDDNDFHGVFRLQKDIFKLSTIGMIYTSVERDGDWNRNIGVDFDLRFKNIYRIRGMAAFSYNKHVEKGNNGMYFFNFFRSQDEGINFGFTVRRVEPNVYVPAGYVSNVDFQNYNLVGRYSIRREGKWLERINFTVQKIAEQSVMEKLKVQDRYSFSANFTTRNRLGLFLNYSFGKFRTKLINGDYQLVYDPTIYSTNIYAVNFYYEGSRSVRFGLNGFLYNDFAIDDSFRETRKGITSQFSVYCNFTFSPQLQVRLDYGKSIFRSDDRVIDFNGDLVSASVNYQVSKRISSFVKFQYDSYYERYQYDILIGYEPANISKIYFSIKNYSEHRLRIFKPDVRSISFKVSYLFRI